LEDSFIIARRTGFLAIDQKHHCSSTAKYLQLHCLLRCSAESSATAFNIDLALISFKKVESYYWIKICFFFFNQL
jgi:hypothetical protein